LARVSFRSNSELNLRDDREPEGDLQVRVAESSITGSRFWQISPDLLGVLKADGYFGSCNPAWTAVLGWTEDEVRSMSIFELLHPEDRERTRGGFEHLKRGNPILRFENRYRRKDGGYNWFAWAAAPLGSDYYCCGRDITLEKEQAIALEATRAERDRVWKNSRDLLVIVGSDGVFRAVNPAWTEILGYAPDEVVGHSFLDFVLPEDADLTQGGLDTAVSVRDLTISRTATGTKTAASDGSPGTPPRKATWSTLTGGMLLKERWRKQNSHKLRRRCGSPRKWKPSASLPVG
jgi:PAS domain S-box-containing protein